MKARDLFAGIGWAVAARQLGIEDHGVDNEDAVRLARQANGLVTIGTDATKVDGAEGDYVIDIGSPPCERFSSAGHRDGVDLMPLLIRAARTIANGDVDRGFGLLNQYNPKIALVLDPLRVLLESQTTMHVVWEQVPSVIPLWRESATILREMGWSAVAACINAADYGVAQDRRRAVMLARRDGKPALIPPKQPEVTLGDVFPELPQYWRWYSNYSAPGRPGATAAERGRTWRAMSEVSGTITRKAWRWWDPRADQLHTAPVSHSARLQGFPDDVVFPGTVGEQRLIIGNAVPVPMARALLQAVVL